MNISYLGTFTGCDDTGFNSEIYDCCSSLHPCGLFEGTVYILGSKLCWTGLNWLISPWPAKKSFCNERQSEISVKWLYCATHRQAQPRADLAVAYCQSCLIKKGFCDFWNWSIVHFNFCTDQPRRNWIC